MKSYAISVAAVITLAIPVVSFAQQSDGPVTRAQVREELRQIEAAGYNPASNDWNYPADVQAAMARIQAGQGAANQNLGIGGSAGGASQWGSAAATTSKGIDDLYTNN
jgi:hypothetical protein